MQNPSYLIRSRHAIFYFRYPLERYDGKRISISLQTRCPKEALRLCKALEYHACMVTSNPDNQNLDYADIRDVLRRHFADVLKRMKRKIDKNGVLSDQNVQSYRNIQLDLQDAIEHERDEIDDDLFCDEVPEQFRIDTKLQPIAERYNVPYEVGGREREFMRKEYKHAFHGFIEALLDYNSGAGYYDYKPKASNNLTLQNNQNDLKLGRIIERYVSTLKVGTAREKKDSINYLVDVLGSDFCIAEVDYPTVRKIRDMLVGTPTNRSKMVKTRGLPLEQQISECKKHNLERIKGSTVNKYLRCMGALFRWATREKYIAENPFHDIYVEVDKKAVTRLNFTDGEVQKILNAVNDIKTNSAVGMMQYWGSLLAIYTGARLNEIASLTPDDVVLCKKSSIWYISINEDGVAKSVKTRAGKRLVPIHPELLELGFLEYVEHAREVIKKRPLTDNGYPQRLIYNNTYREGTWGKKFGRWFNDTFLPSLDLKTELHVLHSVRHSFITNLNDAEVSPIEIATLAGHEHKTVTFGTYAKYGVKHLPASYKAIKKLSFDT